MKSWLQTTLLVSVLASAGAQAASTVGNAAARVLEHLQIVNKDPLNFGFISPGASGGSVTVTPQGARSASGTVQVSGAHGRALFEVQGAASQAYSIHVPASQQFTALEPHDDASLVHVLTVQSFTIVSKNEGAGNSGRLDHAGRDEITLGGTLIVPANAVPGTYSGLVPITVSY